MSGTFPSSPGFTAVNFRTANYNLSSTSLSGRTQVRAIGSQRWEFTVELPVMDRSEYGALHAFIMKQRGMLESFQIVLPIISMQSGDASGSKTVNGALSVGATTVNLHGGSGTLKAGDVFKFAGHNKVYMFTADRNGNGNVTFEPPLTTAVTNNEGLVITSVPFTVRINNDVQEYNYATDGTVSYEIDMIEVI
jgi:hypothetical protein